METPFTHTNKTFICISEEAYAFGTCAGSSSELFDAPKPCYMAFQGKDTILFGKAAYDSTARIRFPVFGNPEKMQEILNLVRDHHIQVLNLQSNGCAIQGTVDNGIPIWYCYDMMINFIVESFVEKVPKYGYTLDEVTVFIPSGLNDAVMNHLKKLLLVASHHHGFKIQFANIKEALKHKLSLEVCNSMAFKPSENTQFLTIDIGVAHTRLEFFKGKHLDIENIIEIFFDNNRTNSIKLLKSEYQRIVNSIEDFDKFRYQSRDNQLRIENEFRRKLEIKQMNSRVYGTFDIYKIGEDDEEDVLIKTISLNRVQFERIIPDVYNKMNHFYELDESEQVEIFKEITSYECPQDVRIVLEKFDTFALPTMANIPYREINFYDVESVEEKIVDFGNYEFEDKFIEAIEIIGDSKFGGPIESKDRNKKRADIMNVSAGFASNASTLYFEDLNDDKIPIDVDETIDALREYFVPLFKSIKEFILKNYDSGYSDELRYIFVDSKNQIFKRIFNETFVYEFQNIRMVDINSNDGFEFSYKGGAYYLYARQNQFRPETVSEEDINGYYNRYQFFADVRHWLNRNYQDVLAVTSKINTEKKALEKVYKQFNQKFDIKTFNNAIKELKAAYRVADQYKEAYLVWRRGWCSDELVAQYIPQVDKRLF